jgi:uncharacterized membrane protein
MVLLALWERLRTSYWFIPAIMSVAAAALGISMVEVDRRVDQGWVQESHWLSSPSTSSPRWRSGRFPPA